MGIQRLLPFLDNSTRDACISEFENEFVAVDAYCWLHKGIHSCAFELAMQKPTTKYVTYCMRYIEMLCHYKVKPILVFDGRQLCSKLETEKKRREERKRKFERGKELLRAGNSVESKKLLGESVDVTHDMAVNLMKECREKNIDCIVAPYEADAQLAFFSLRNVVKCVITEDSDLLAYGCERVMFKMDIRGNGKLVEKSNLHFSLGMTPEELDADMFRYICILSGCDYLPSLKSIGPKNALKFVKLVRGKSIYDELPKLPIYLRKEKLHITSEYLEGFKIAENTFQHQLVYDPFRRVQIPLKPVRNDDDVVGEKLPEDEAFQLAVGNIDPITMKKVQDYDPDKFGVGFTVLWRTDLLPNAAPRRNILSSRNALVETKKRQREGLEFDSVNMLSNNLKKPCIPLITTSIVNSFAKDSQKIPANGFIFEPKILSEKKDNFKIEEESKVLNSRYFAVGNSKKPKTERLVGINHVSAKRKDESDEEYLRGLFEESCWSDEEEMQESCACGGGSSQSENKCALCSKCSRCCHCIYTQTQSESQESDERTVEVTENIEPIQHSLLDEIYSKEKEESNEHQIKQQSKPPSPSQRSQYCNVLSRFSSKETCGIVDLDEGKNNDKEVISNALNRSPSPVFIPQKTNSLKMENVLDTAGTRTSVYFPSDAKLSNRTPQVSKRTISTSQRKLGVRASGSVLSKPCRNSVKNSLMPRTLFDFGFKKDSQFGNIARQQFGLSTHQNHIELSMPEKLRKMSEVITTPMSTISTVFKQLVPTYSEVETPEKEIGRTWSLDGRNEAYTEF